MWSRRPACSVIGRPVAANFPSGTGVSPVLSLWCARLGNLLGGQCPPYITLRYWLQIAVIGRPVAAAIPDHA